MGLAQITKNLNILKVCVKFLSLSNKFQPRKQLFSPTALCMLCKSRSFVQHASTKYRLAQAAHANCCCSCTLSPQTATVVAVRDAAPRATTAAHLALATKKSLHLPQGTKLMISLRKLRNGANLAMGLSGNRSNMFSEF